MKKLTFLFALLCASVMTFAINWSVYDWIVNGSSDASNTNKYKMAEHGYVNIQLPGFASQAGIYSTFDGAITYCSLGTGNYAVQGAGLCMYVSAFTAQETEVLVVDATHRQYIFYVYKDGASGTAYLNDIVPSNVYDTNFALETNGGWASATSGNAWEAIDANNGTRWESAFSDLQTWTLDLGRKRIFNTVQIRWEGAYGKTFTIDVSNDNSSWTTVKTVTDQVLDGFPYEQTLEFSETTARYVRFNGTARGTGYGYSFWEFRVLFPGVSVLTSIDLTAGASIAEVDGAGVALTAQPKDQNGQNMAESVSWEITPAAAGHMSGSTYIPDQIGAANIRAYNGSVYSSAVTICGYAGSNLALSTNISTDNKVIDQSEFSPSGTDAFYAVDTNEESVYQGSASGGTAADQASRTFDAWFTLDLGNFYDINLVTIKFEGACSELYHLDFSEDNSTWDTGYNYVGSEGINDHTDYLTSLTNNTKVRYVRFWSTRAATQWGMKIFDMKVFGTGWVDSGDTEAPVMTSASLVSKSSKSAVIAVAATDNVEVTKYHVVNTSPAVDVKLVPADGKIIVTGLAAETAYNFTITAMDAAQNESANNKTVAVTTDAYSAVPTVAAPTPTWPADQVKSLYSDTYTFAPASLNSYNEGWYNPPTMTEEAIAGNHYLKYNGTMTGMIGWQFATISVATMEFVHVDIWPSEDGTIYMGPTSTGSVVASVPCTVEAGKWNSIDIPISDLRDANGSFDPTALFQNQFTGYSAQSVFSVDNVYFYRETPYVDSESPTNVVATLLSTSFISASIRVSALDNSGSVLYVIKNGETQLATGGGDSGANVTIDIPNLTPGTHYNLSVIAKDDAGNAASPVMVELTTRALPAAPPAPILTGKDCADIFCDDIAGGPVINIGGWGQSTVATSIPFTPTNNVFYFRNFNYLGWELTPAVNATDMQFVHVDIYSPSMTSIGITPISPGRELSTAQVLTPGVWTSLDIPLSVFASANIEWNNIFQFKFDSGDGSSELFVDNVYFWRAKATTNVDNWASYASARNVTVPDGLTAYKAEYQKIGDEEQLVLTDIGSVIPAYAGVLLRGTANTEYHFALTDASGPDMSDNDLVGCAVRTDISAVHADYDVFCLRRSDLYDQTGFFLYTGQYIPAGKAYLKLAKDSGTPAPERRLRLVINETETTTSIDHNAADGTVSKFIRDGQLFIRRGDTVYTIQGVLVK